MARTDWFRRITRTKDAKAFPGNYVDEASTKFDLKELELAK